MVSPTSRSRSPAPRPTFTVVSLVLLCTVCRLLPSQKLDVADQLSLLIEPMTDLFAIFSKLVSPQGKILVPGINEKVNLRARLLQWGRIDIVRP